MSENTHNKYNHKNGRKGGGNNNKHDKTKHLILKYIIQDKCYI
jgi:hypothetical protein